MKQVLVETIKYICIFLLTVLIGFCLLVLTAKIPKEAIKENMKESLQFYKDRYGIDNSFGEKHTYIHYYADSILLNIIYNIDSEKPVESVLWSKYYETLKMDVNVDFINTVECDKAANTQYLRYWHGSMSILRPLFIVFNANQIYILNAILLWGLAIALFIILFMKHKRLAFIYLISLIMAAFYIVPKCFEYSWTFYIMFIVSIISVLNEKKKSNKWFYTLFFVSGIITCYLDFLTTEILTIFVPLILILAIRKKHERLGEIKEICIFIIISTTLWLIGYAGMWIAKWSLAGIILNINPLEYIEKNMIQRIYGGYGYVKAGGFNLLGANSNLWTIYPLVYVKNIIARTWVTVAILLVPLVTIDWKNIKGKWIALIYVLIALMPYARYFVLTAHSTSHYFFTYRSQIITVIALLLAYTESLNFNIFKKKIQRRDGNKNE